MAKKAQDSNVKKVGITLRLDPETNRIFSALLLLNETNANDYLRYCVDAYIKKHKGMINLPDDKSEE